MNNIDAYIDELNAEVELRRDEYPLPVMAFTAYIMDEIAPMTNVNEHDTIHCLKRDKSERIQGEIHGYGISENEEVLYLYYSLYSSGAGTSASSLQRKDFDTAINRLQGFYNLAIRGAHLDVDQQSDEYEVFKFIYDHQRGIMAVRLCVLSNSSIGDYSIRDIRIDGKNVEHDIWDIKKIYANLHSGMDHVAIDIDFEEDYSNIKLPYIEMNSDNFNYKCILTMFPAKLLYKLYHKYNTDLLAGNVRYFLKYKGKKDSNANIGIRQTLKDENERQMFLAYNNGITAIARDVETDNFDRDTKVEDDGDSANDYISAGTIRKLLDFRIVNGGQTTACIFDTKRNDRQINYLGVYVTVKIIVLRDSNKDLIQKVIRYTNSQSRIKPSDFSSGNRFNIALEALSRNITVPNEENRPSYWFYERIRGQYDIEKTKGSTKIERDYFTSCNSPKMRFNKETLAKAWVSWNQEPHEAVKGAATTYSYFMKPIEDSGYIPDEQYYKKSIVLLIIYNFILSRPETRTYGNGKAPIAAYVMAYLSMFTNNNLDFEKIWKRQDLSPEMKTFLNKLCEGIWNKFSTCAAVNSQTILSYSKRKDAFDSIRSEDLGCRIEDIKDDL